MSDPTQSINFVLRQEDSTLAGTITNESNDAGGLTRFGLSAKWHPELVEAGFYEASMDAQTALPIAQQAYETAYASPLCLMQINSQAIANALLSFAVNCGTFSATEILQQVCGAIADGCMGPNTVAAVNRTTRQHCSRPTARSRQTDTGGLQQPTRHSRSFSQDG